MPHLAFRQFVVLAFTVILSIVSPAQNAPPASSRKPAAARQSSIAIVVDNSNAAKKNFDDMKSAVVTFLKSSEAEDELCLFSAGGKARLVEDFTTDTSLLKDRVKKLKAEGRLALNETIR